MADMLLRMPAFPAPWLTLQADAKEAFLDSLVLPARLRAFYDASGPQTGEEWRFTVGVDFRRGVPAIKHDFGLWLDKKRELLNADKLQKIRTPTGKGAVPNYEALKWLAAFRFRQAGITHSAGQAMVQRRIKSEPVDFYLCGLPDYTAAKNRSRAVALARMKLTALEHLPSSRFLPAPDSPFA
jgi:hypothetical protein